MNCQNRYCVYWKESTCVRDEISVDAMGVCQCCVLIKVPDACIEEQRKLFLGILKD